jgi:hypothetical protein
MENFSNLVDEKLGQQAETSDEIEKRVKKELVEKGKESADIEFKFIEPKLRVKPEDLPRNLNWELFPKNIAAEEKERLTLMFNKMIDYLDALIITDNFSNHDERGNWERKYRDELSPEAYNCYKNNRLGLTNGSRPLSFLRYLLSQQEDYGSQTETFINPKILAQLEIFVSTMSPELKSGDIYGRTSLDRKIEIADEEMPRVFSAVIRTLGERIAKPQN